MLRVTPIGSCRIAGPLHRAQDRLGITCNKGRVYGYCHSSGEAVQMARFLRGEFVPILATWPLISRGTDLGVISAQHHDPSDLYVIELSSAKRLTVNGVFVQLNYVTSSFADFFADDTRARAFWVRAEDGNQATIDRFLAKQPVLETDRTILRTLRLSLTTPEELRADIATLQTLLPRILIVTHANAHKSDGMPIATRATFIDMVKDAAHAVGARVFDPTKRMLEMGQSIALADHSAGLAHYSDTFADALCDEWSDLAIGPAIDDLVRDGGANTVKNVLEPHVAALSCRVPFKRLHDRLTGLARDGVSVAHIATSLDAARRNLDPISDPALTAYLCGQFDELARILANAETLPPADNLLTYAKAAPDGSAKDILMLGLAAYPEAATLADRLASLLLIEDTDSTREIPERLRSILLRHITPLQRVKLSVAFGWELQIVAQDLTPEDVTEVAAYLAASQGHKVALSFLELWQEYGPLPATTSALLGKWCNHEKEERAETVAFCLSVIALDPRNTTARNRLRDIRRSIRNDMREMVDLSNQEGLDALARVNALLPEPLPEVDLFRARACFGAGDYTNAIKIGRIAAEALPDNLSVWVLLMRAAHKAQKATLSARFAKRVITLAKPDATRLAQEAANRIRSSALVPHD